MPIGWFELLIIVVIAILVIGPKDFPIVLRKIGSFTGTIKSYFSDIQSNVNQLTNMEDEHKDNKKKDNNKINNPTKDEHK
tara:strand:- start:192 stop:431 length:240 start_codon:yes stop_codon:yes gene_type:complete